MATDTGVTETPPAREPPRLATLPSPLPERGSVRCDRDANMCSHDSSRSDGTSRRAAERRSRAGVHIHAATAAGSPVDGSTAARAGRLGCRSCAHWARGGADRARRRARDVRVARRLTRSRSYGHVRGRAVETRRWRVTRVEEASAGGISRAENATAAQPSAWSVPTGGRRGRALGAERWSREPDADGALLRGSATAEEARSRRRDRDAREAAWDASAEVGASAEAPGERRTLPGRAAPGGGAATRSCHGGPSRRRPCRAHGGDRPGGDAVDAAVLAGTPGTGCCELAEDPARSRERAPLACGREHRRAHGARGRTLTWGQTRSIHRRSQGARRPRRAAGSRAATERAWKHTSITGRGGARASTTWCTCAATTRARPRRRLPVERRQWARSFSRPEGTRSRPVRRTARACRARRTRGIDHTPA